MKLIKAFFAVSITSATLGCHGTEVGNGRSYSPDEKTDAAGGQTSNPPASQAPDPASESPSKPIDSIASLRKHLFVECASPMAEVNSGAFADERETLKFTVTASSWSVALGSSATPLASGTLLKSAEEPYKISSTSQDSKTLSCSSVVTEPTKRTVTFSDRYKLSWTLDSQNEVNAIFLQDPAGTIVLSYLKQ